MVPGESPGSDRSVPCSGRPVVAQVNSTETAGPHMAHHVLECLEIFRIVLEAFGRNRDIELAVEADILALPDHIDARSGHQVHADVFGRLKIAADRPVDVGRADLENRHARKKFRERVAHRREAMSDFCVHSSAV